MSGLGDYVKCGWPDDDEYKENTGGGGGGGSGGGGDMTLEERLYKFRFQIPTPEKNEPSRLSRYSSSKFREISPQ